MPEAALSRPPRVAGFATQGSDSNDERRLRELLEPLGAVIWPVRRDRGRVRSVWSLVRRGLRERPDVVVMEGTGVAGGVAVLMLRAAGVSFVVSSGDAVAPFVRLVAPGLGPIAALYERLLYRASLGFVGWTPYLVGRALALGAPRAVTAPGWAPPAVAGADRDTVRDRLAIPREAVVFGIAGSLRWSGRRGYCYGMELTRAVARVQRRDVRVLIVGDGSGLARLREICPGDARVVFTGAVPREQVAELLGAMDVASLPQSVDGIGVYRYTTKLSEYLAAGLPIVSGRTPAAYDVPGAARWRLPGRGPWDEAYVAAMSELMENVRPGDLAERVPAGAWPSRAEQQRRVGAFLTEALDEARPG